jgi:hypothetical protein
MATPSTVARPFSALSGQEIKKIILNEIERNLEADYRFKNHLTYPMVSWRWVLAAKVYPSEAPDIRVELDKTMRSPGVPATFTGFDGIEPVEIEVTSERTVAAPAAGETADSARRDAGLEVPAPRIVRGPSNTKFIVDAPTIPIATQSEPTKPAEVTESPVARTVNRARESKTIPAAPARAVAIKTRANPSGVEVAPAAGSPPDEGRLAEIEDREANKPPEPEE